MNIYNFIKKIILISPLFAIFMLWGIPVTHAATPVFNITSEELNFENGSRFWADINLDTKGESIKQTDVTILFDPEVLQVIDQNSEIPDIQISEESDLGTFQLNTVDQDSGVIKISVFGNAIKSSNLVLAHLLFETIDPGKTQISIDVNNTIVYNSQDNPIGFRVTDLVITRIIEDYQGIRIMHVQSTYLAAENRPITIKVKLETNHRVNGFKIYYRKIDDSAEFKDPWTEGYLTDDNEDGLYAVTIPAENVQIPGITYYFKAFTSKGVQILPRPITLENAYKIHIVKEEDLDDSEGPIISLSPPGASFEENISVSASSNELNTTIFCTTDGSEPTNTSYIYLNPFEITENTTIKCFGIDAVGNPGETIVGEYTKGGSTISATFTGDPLQIIKGQTSMLSWQTDKATKVEISPGLGEVALNGQSQVQPLTTTTYTLKASSGELDIEKTVTIYVTDNNNNEPPPDNPPTGPEDILFLLVGAMSTTWILKNRETCS